MAEERLEVEFPPRFGIGKGLPPVDPVISQKIFREFIHSNPLGLRSNEVARRDLGKLLFEDVLRIALIRCPGALAVGLPIPVILDPPN